MAETDRTISIDLDEEYSRDDDGTLKKVPVPGARRPRTEAEADEAERRADAAEANARAVRAQNNAAAWQGAYHRHDAEAAAAKAEYEGAHERGDFGAAAEAQTKLTAAINNRTHAERNYHAANRGAQEPADPVGSMMSRFSGETQAWLRAHPEEARAMATDPNGRRAKKVAAAHEDALAEGYQPDTPQYFRHVEGFIGAKGGDNSGNSRRSTGGRSTTGGTRVTLTPGEVEAAKDGRVVWNRGDVAAGRCKANQVGEPVGLVEFGRRKLAMQKQGFYDQ